MYDRGIVPVDYIFLGGSPKHVISASLAVSVSVQKKLIGLSRSVSSNDPKFIDMLNKGEQCWVDMPLYELKARVFVSSCIFAAPGERPLWYFIYLIIRKPEWNAIKSYKNLINAINTIFPHGWVGVGLEKFGKLQLPISESTHLYNSIDDELNDLDNCLPMLNNNNFENIKIACNPSALYFNYDKIISTRKMKIMSYIVLQNKDNSNNICNVQNCFFEKDEKYKYLSEYRRMNGAKKSILFYCRIILNNVIKLLRVL